MYCTCRQTKTADSLGVSDLHLLPSRHRGNNGIRPFIYNRSLLSQTVSRADVRGLLSLARVNANDPATSNVGLKAALGYIHITTFFVFAVATLSAVTLDKPT